MFTCVPIHDAKLPMCNTAGGGGGRWSEIWNPLIEPRNHYLGKCDAIYKTTRLHKYVRPSGWVFWWKKQMRKISWQGPFKQENFYNGCSFKGLNSHDFTHWKFLRHLSACHGICLGTLRQVFLVHIQHIQSPKLLDLTWNSEQHSYEVYFLIYSTHDVIGHCQFLTTCYSQSALVLHRLLHLLYLPLIIPCSIRDEFYSREPGGAPLRYIRYWVRALTNILSRSYILLYNTVFSWA